MSRPGVIGCHYTACPWWLGTFRDKSWDVSQPSLKSSWHPWLPCAMVSCKVSSGNNCSAKRGRWSQSLDISWYVPFHQVGQKSSCMKSLALMDDLEIPADIVTVWQLIPKATTWQQPGNNLVDRRWSELAARRFAHLVDVNLTTAGAADGAKVGSRPGPSQISFMGEEALVKRRWAAVGATNTWGIAGIACAHVDPDRAYRAYRIMALHRFAVLVELPPDTARQCSNCMSAHSNTTASSFNFGKAARFCGCWCANVPILSIFFNVAPAPHPKQIHNW